jgi:ABC-2 type transport system permease protein
VKTSRALTIARTDLRQLRQSRDFWMPMLLMALLFFVVLPTVLLLGVVRAERLGAVQQVGEVLDDQLPELQQGLQGQTAGQQRSYGLAVYLLAPLAVVVPMTISSAVGANTIVGEREKGTGEFLANSPATEREIYLGKLIASLLPGYVATLAGFAVYSVIVNLIVGPSVGGWFFPTGNWYVLILWVVPPFLALGLSLILQLSGRVKSATAAQQSTGLITLPLILLSYAQSSGFVFSSLSGALTVGAIAWGLALLGLWRGASAVSRARLLGADAA